MSLPIDDGNNTEMCSRSTPLCVENIEPNTTNLVDFVLDASNKRRYRRNMTKKPTHGLRAIGPKYLQAAFDLAKINRGVSQGQMAHDIGCRQQTISHVLLGDTKEGGWKWPIIRYLGPELWQIAIEKNDETLRKHLHALGLQPKDDNVMTIAEDDRVSARPEYSFDLYEPSLARGDDTTMVFPSRPTAKTRPPHFEHSERSYAIRMIGDMMQPVFKSGDELLVDPLVAPRTGDNCVILNADRTRDKIGHLVIISPEIWRIVHRPGTRLEEAFDLPVSEWPYCEKIVGVHYV